MEDLFAAFGGTGEGPSIFAQATFLVASRQNNQYAIVCILDSLPLAPTVVTPLSLIKGPVLKLDFN